MNNIPTLNIADFESDPTTFVNAFGIAYSEWGFAGISGHEVSSSLIENAFKAAQAYFALPEQVKRKYETDAPGKSRGYVRFGTEKAKDSSHSDLKEFYHIGRQIDGISHLHKNIWPSEIDTFETSFTALFKALDQLAHLVLKVVALYLQLPDDYFQSRVDKGEALLRVLHYPPILDQSTPNVRAAAHEDINLITLLVGSEQEGLEVLSRQGKWIPISMIEGAIICNVGDMLQRLTNGMLPSTTHRVVNPEGENACKSRYSIPFFMHPNPNTDLDCLPQCVSEQRPLQYPPIKAHDYLNQRLTEIGLLNK